MGVHTGGIVDLARFLREYGWAVEADFHRFYGVDDFNAAMDRGLRWVLVRVKALPPDAALWRVLPELQQAQEDEETVDVGGRRIPAAIAAVIPHVSE